MIAELGANFAEFVSGNHEGTVTQQGALVEALRKTLGNRVSENRLGWLLEFKLDQFGDGPGLQRPWLELACEIATGTASRPRTHLAFRAFHSTMRSPWTTRIRALLLAHPANLIELHQFVGCLFRSDEAAADWLGWIAQARLQGGELVDEWLWAMLCEDWADWSRRDQACRHAKYLVHDWLASGHCSRLAHELLMKLGAGNSLESLLQRDC
jgi:hypothetical protein